MIHFCNSDNWNKYNLVQEMQDDSKMKGSRIISPLYQMLICTQKVKVQYTIWREV